MQKKHTNFQKKYFDIEKLMNFFFLKTINLNKEQTLEISHIKINFSIGIGLCCQRRLNNDWLQAGLMCRELNVEKVYSQPEMIFLADEKLRMLDDGA